MTQANTIELLRRLDRTSNQLRLELGISAPNRLLFRARRALSDSAVVFAEADGTGGAWVCIVEGNYPFDFLMLFERQFIREMDAVRVAQSIVDGEADPEVALDPWVPCELNPPISTKGMTVR